MKKIRIPCCSDDPNFDRAHLAPLIAFLMKHGSVPVTGQWRNDPDAMVYEFKNRINFKAIATEVELPHDIEVIPLAEQIFDTSSGSFICGNRDPKSFHHEH